MNVKISYTVPFERVPSKVDELLMEAGRTLEGVGSLLKPNEFDESSHAIIEKLDKIEKMRKELIAVDLILNDCYSILAGYNKALADMKMPRQQEPLNDAMADERGSSVYPSESTSNKV